LHPIQLVADLEGQVRAPVFGDRLEHRDSSLDGLERDCRFRDVSLPVRVDHEQMFPTAPDGFAAPAETAHRVG
jgi:hypothetical protein